MQSEANMSLVLRLFIVVFCIILALFVLHEVSKERMLLKYSLLWLALTLVLLVCAVFPEIVFIISDFFGFETPANFIFVVGFFCLLAIALSLSIIVSGQTIKLKNLTQRIAINQYDEEKSTDLGNGRE